MEKGIFCKKKQKDNPSISFSLEEKTFLVGIYTPKYNVKNINQ